MKNRSALISIAALIVTSFISMTAIAATQFTFNLEPGQEVPPVVSSASGSCNVVLAGTLVSVNCTFQDLSTPAVAAHIHNAGQGINGGVILPLTATNATSGTITGNGNITADQAEEMLLGLTYINLHSQAIPSGEIRGQIVGASDPSAIPTLSQWGMIGLTFVLLMVAYSAFRARQKV